jgi:peptidoglycan/xylan/chitin deacetylase (PgdA/CDA1 family)
MSAVTTAIGLAKKAKRRFAKTLKKHEKTYLSPVRRIDRVAVKERVCAMTFDDGPCRLPGSPSEDGKPLTLSLLETLERFGARGTFDVVGDTSGNYPDKAGKEGSADWGGVRFDHYPDFQKDANGGAQNCPELVKRILDGGHEITSHSYSHVLFGPKPLVYGSREPLPGLDAVVADLQKLDALLKNEYHYTIRLSRPPHYVDATKDGFTSYDAYAQLGYQYLGASFDGAGWLPLGGYGAEVDAMTAPLQKALQADPDALCGQIIFQKDGYNMARRSPVADGLPKQLELLTNAGYRVVTVSELMALCPFTDLSPDDELFPAAKKLLDAGFTVCFRDNTVRPKARLTRGELAMLVYGREAASRRVELVRAKLSPFKDVPYQSPYAAAVELAVKKGALQCEAGRFFPNEDALPGELSALCTVFCGRAPLHLPASLTHGSAIAALASIL